jgi:hypothetical protein
MKKVFWFLLLMIAVSLNGFAQENHEFKSVFGVSPFRLWNGLRLKYERVLTPKVTYGGILTGYYGSTPGIQLAPIARYYFKGTAPEGFYAQAKIVGSFQSRNITVDIYDRPYDGFWGSANRIATEDRKQTFTSFGAGLAAGYQLLWGKNSRWSVDINLGVKFVGNIPEPTLKENEKTLDLDNLGWYLTGPGSIVDGLVSIGYRF